MIVKTDQGYQVRSESGKNMSQPNLSHGQAEKRLEQVEYFKHQGGAAKKKGSSYLREALHGGK